MEIRTTYQSFVIKHVPPALVAALLWIGLPQVTSRVLGWQSLEWLQGLGAMALALVVWVALLPLTSRLALREEVLCLEAFVLSRRGKKRGRIDLSRPHESYIELGMTGASLRVEGEQGQAIWLWMEGADASLLRAIEVRWWVQQGSGTHDTTQGVDSAGGYQLYARDAAQRAFVEAVTGALWRMRVQDRGFARYARYPWDETPRPLPYARHFVGTLPADVQQEWEDLRAASVSPEELGVLATADMIGAESGLARTHYHLLPRGGTRMEVQLVNEEDWRSYGFRMRFEARDERGVPLSVEVDGYGRDRYSDARALARFVNEAC